MKVFLLALLVVLMCSTQVHTLRCFVCEGEEGCATATECLNHEKFCKMSFTETSVSRSCASECKMDENQDCCMEDECNH
ncbi:unnamed protein product [Arctogadus glacialis]|uniref:weak toxin 3-like n=1 Tax=Gadus chalcogrammus TaxID=1042646 RepID=UPI0024C4B1C1|nr:weak toxin 3-like [Gadus chalcogrammus]XP_056467506.1 weak toxin 3-like [Gadus chalcogrammus]